MILSLIFIVSAEAVVNMPYSGPEAVVIVEEHSLIVL